MIRFFSANSAFSAVSFVGSTTQPPPFSRGLRGGRGWTALSSANSEIFKSQRSHAGSVEQVLGVHDHGTLDDALDAVKVQGAELRPAGAEDQRVRALGHGICRIAIA